ncbi:hypothetical protein A1F94_008875 [Pyrenophora tritici-repentis]|nr:hypothetical protein A1F94_008875 [Pyrenophora tritici-repentis]
MGRSPSAPPSASKSFWSMLIRLIKATGSSWMCSSSWRLVRPPLDCVPERFLSSLSAPSLYPEPVSICLDSIDFFRRNPAPEPWRPTAPSGDSDSASPERRLVRSILSSMNVLNSMGASSGCSRAGTQNSFDASSSSDMAGGDGGELADLNEGRSGSALLTPMDILRIACRLLSSCARPAGLDS